jgi:hypothetical protein
MRANISQSTVLLEDLLFEEEDITAGYRKFDSKRRALLENIAVEPEFLRFKAL